jgi:hypothetical protein
MIFTRSYRMLPVGLLLLALPASSAAGATKKSKSPARPTITSVAPLKLGVGDMLTIRGTNFIVGKKVNSVAFKRAGSPALFVKAAESTRTRMKVIVPASIRTHLATKGGVALATRFRMRILARRFAKSYTPDKLSPTIDPSVTVDDKTGATAPVAPGAGAPGVAAGTPAAPAAPPDCDIDGIVDAADPDDDNDQLSDVLEVTLKTNPCAKDSDGDGLEDGWEYYSAIDLNSSNVPSAIPPSGVPSDPRAPYPGKRPYPNPLDASDAGIDHDGDSLTAREEHALWVKFTNRALPLSYSDGTQFTGVPVPAPTDPTLVHLNVLHATDGPRDVAELSDDEKDADGDRLGNFDETHGRMLAGYWRINYKNEKMYPDVYPGTDFLDPDTDGDGILDGNDDQDHDDWSNVDELNRGPWMVHPQNPCLPDYMSRSCPRYIPEGVQIYAPFDGPTLPSSPVPWP